MGIDTDNSKRDQKDANIEANIEADMGVLDDEVMAEDTAAIPTPKEKRTWEQTLDLLRDTYTVSIRGICMQLKSSRSWVSQYVTPYLDKIYLDNGYRGNKMRSKSWTQMAALYLEDDRYLADSLWLHEERYKELIRACITSSTKQMKKIPVELLVGNKSAFQREYGELHQELQRKKTRFRMEGFDMTLLREISLADKELKQSYERYLSYTGKCVLKDNRVDVTKRSSVIPVEVPVPDVPIEKWEAVHDKKGYGDTTESVLREFFREGYVRIELHIPDPKELADPAAIFDPNSGVRRAMGDNMRDSMRNDRTADNGPAGGSHTVNGIDMAAIKHSEKVFYIPDPEPIKHQYVDQYISIQEAIWQQYRNKLIP